jgi:hypothetical protein
MNREVHVRICERLGVRFPGPTRHEHRFRGGANEFGLPPTPDVLRHSSELTLRATERTRSRGKALRAEAEQVARVALTN